MLKQRGPGVSLGLAGESGPVLRGAPLGIIRSTSALYGGAPPALKLSLRGGIKGDLPPS